METATRSVLSTHLFFNYVFHISAAVDRERPVQLNKKHWSCAIVGSATVPTSFGGHGGPPDYS
jgi:hypothetical protein